MFNKYVPMCIYYKRLWKKICDQHLAIVQFYIQVHDILSEKVLYFDMNK